MVFYEESKMGEVLQSVARVVHDLTREGLTVDEVRVGLGEGRYSPLGHESHTTQIK